MARKAITEVDILDAVEHCDSFREMSVYLRTHRNTLVKYCKLLLHTESGMSYFDYIKTRQRQNTVKTKYIYTNPALFDNMITGESKHINYSMLKSGIIRHGYFDGTCTKCGFSEANISTQEVPTVLVFMDGNRKNTHIDNLDLTCLNCYALIYDTIHSSRNGIIQITGYV